MRYAAYSPISHSPRAEALTSAYDLFQSGMDTEQIARLRWQKEAQVLREINIERSARIRRLSPYRVVE